MSANLKWIAPLLLVACQPPEPPPFVTEDEFIATRPETTCSVAFECACPDLDWPDEETCLELVTLRTADTQMVAADAGLKYDGVCVARRRERLEAAACQTEADDLLDAACAEACKPYVGTVEEGDTCQRFGITVDLDDCAQGLRCDDDKTCVPLCEPTEPLAEGDRCMAGIEVLGQCETDLFCDVTDGRCRVAATVGEPCNERPCAGDAVCDLGLDPRTCVPLRDAGEACTNGDQCQSGRCEEQEQVCGAEAAIACGL